MATDDRQKNAALHLLSEGMVTLAEAADLAACSRQLMRHWALRAGIDVHTRRAEHLDSLWRGALRAAKQ